MPTIKVQVKWQQELYNDVEVDLEQPPAVFKAQMFALTGVRPDRQKIMVKGSMLKDDADWKKLGIKEGQKLMMMGSRDEAPVAPTNAPVFVEDLPEDEQDVTGFGKYGAGLENLGNTCYMNSTLQCLYAVPELRNALITYPTEIPGTSMANQPGRLSHRLTVGVKQLFQNMEKSAQPVTPLPFLSVLREKYPQFAEQEQGHYKQQDAEECYTQLVWTLRECLKDDVADPVIKKLFGIDLKTQLDCEETGEKIEESNTTYSLKCNITIDVNYLHQGLQLGLKEDREKHSTVAQRDVLFKGSSRIASLPPYLTVQLVRFFYKVDVQQKAKILRKVTFPTVLDTFDMCTPELHKALEGPRAAYLIADERRAGVKKQKTAAATNGAAGASSAATAGAGDVDMADAALEVDPDELLRKYSGERTGRYDLHAVLTHKGRSADSGHYVAWVRQDDGSWIQFDDDKMIPRKVDDVQTLAGGGDWHMAYLLLYRAQKVPIAPGNEADDKVEEAAAMVTDEATAIIDPEPAGAN